MKKYKKIDISEKQLEELTRKEPDLIEDGLKYIDHQRQTDRGPLDILCVDSGNALVVAELKAVEDDGMLVQGIDYYDYISRNLDGFARAYKDSEIDPTQKPRLLLIAPSFSITLVNRCKWVDIPISLFTFQCISFVDNPKEIITVFKEITIPSNPKPVEVYTIGQRLGYITDSEVRKVGENLLKEIKAWDQENILIEPIQSDISIKVSGKVFAYLGPRRKFFLISTYDTENKWIGYPIHQVEDLEETKILLKNNYERLKL